MTGKDLAWLFPPTRAFMEWETSRLSRIPSFFDDSESSAPPAQSQNRPGRDDRDAKNRRQGIGHSRDFSDFECPTPPPLYWVLAVFFYFFRGFFLFLGEAVLWGRLEHNQIQPVSYSQAF